MKLRTKFLLFVSVLHITALFLTYLIFKENKLLFLLSEVIIIFSIVICWQLYLELIRPLQTMMRGADAIRDQDFNVKFLLTGKYEMDRLILVFNEMMDHLRLERTKQEEQHFFLEKLIQTSPTGIVVLDFDNNIYQVNPKALQVLGMIEKDMFDRPGASLDHPLLREISKLASGESRTVAINGIETYKLQKSHFIDRGFVRSFVMMEEVTAEILAAEKKAYGKVIRMMAHEVNNTIGPVNSILESTLQSGLPNEVLTHAIQVAIQRNNNLNIFMRNFADLVRIPLPDKKQVDLIQLLNGVTDLMRLRAGTKKIDFLQEHDFTSLMIVADPQQMEQVLINIFKNAIEAIDMEGTITLLTHASPKQVIIRDTGNGISPEFEEQLFSPFYSTKKEGQGIGLILIREILRNHGFEFSLRTVSPGLTEFKITFE